MRPTRPASRCTAHRATTARTAPPHHPRRSRSFQLGVQIISFLTMFMLLGGTYLFQSGLLGVLFARFRLLMWTYPAYFVATLVVGIMRVGRLGGTTTYETLWDDNAYFVLSVLHKMVAAAYYVVNFRSIFILGEPRFYTKDEWVAIYRQQARGASDLGASRASSMIGKMPAISQLS
jgi:hypothetical protein